MKTNKITSENLNLTIFMNKNSDTKNKNTYIMNAQGTELINIIQSFLGELDDYMQLAADAGDEDISSSFNEDYNTMENYFILAKINKTMRLNHRNEVRTIMKGALKQAGLYLN